MSMKATTPRTPPSRGRLMWTLFAAQVCGSTGHSIGMAIGGIMARPLKACDAGCDRGPLERIDCLCLFTRDKQP